MLNTFGLLSSLYITLFGALFLLAASSRHYRNRFYLSLFFLISFVVFTGHVLSFYEYWKIFRFLDFAFLAALLLFYPLYFRYLHSAFGYKIFPFNWKVHFAPAMIVGAVMLVSSYWCNRETYQEYMNNNLYGTPMENPHSILLSWLYKGARIIHIAQILFYNTASFVYILRSRKHIQNSFSNLDKFQLHYFYLVNIVFLIFMAVPGIYVTIIGRAPFTENSHLLGIVTFLFTILYVILGMVGLRQKAFTDSEYQKNEALNLLEGEPENVSSGFKSELLKYFEQHAPWRNPNLHIWDVSTALASNRTYISHTINKEFKCNFNTFVNNYRIEEAKRLIENNKNLAGSMDSIAEMAGFGSKSSFVRVFKNSTGTTPAKYKYLN